MAEGCCASLMKWGLAGINFIFGLLAISMLGIGGYVYHVVGDYSVSFWVILLKKNVLRKNMP